MTDAQATRRRKRLIQQACKLSRKADKAMTLYRQCRLYRKANAIFEQVLEEQKHLIGERTNDNQVQTSTAPGKDQTSIWQKELASWVQGSGLRHLLGAE